MKSFAGQLLIASPRLNDQNFFRSVVLVIQHDQEGAFGLVLNRPGPDCFGELWSQLEATPAPGNFSIYMGGPVSGPLMALHSHPLLADRPEVIPGVYFNALGRNELRQLIQSDFPFRLFSGYAGWGKSQLDNELKVGGWLTSSAEATDVFYDPAQMDLWNQCRCRVGGEILAQSLDLSPSDINPDLN